VSTRSHARITKEETMRSPLLVLLCLVLLSCARDPLGPTPHLTLASDAEEYAAPAAGPATVSLRLEHLSGRATALVGCPAPPAAVLEELRDGRWHDAGSQGIYCLAIYSFAAVPFGAGSSLTWNLQIPQPGTYRVRVLAGADLQYPDAVVLSNRFTVRRAP
jgi:hypothetical protein